MPTYTLTDLATWLLLQREAEDQGWPWFDDGDYDLNFFGIRGLSLESNLFDDVIGCGLRVLGQRYVHLWAATTDPGRPYLENPMRPEGCAVLCDGFYPGLWEIGRHRNQYEALVQVGTARVWRDNDRDTILDLEGPTTTDVDGVNMHKAGKDSPVVGRWSGACQVHRREVTFDTAMGLARKQAKDRGWKKYSYKLFTLQKSPRLECLLGVVP